ncbi:MAG TPA: c-type cytochrome [Gemmatimonadaceae bacterium]|nr:c-type cytochrome [Gemmatimonadaceae bacterium]
MKLWIGPAAMFALALTACDRPGSDGGVDTAAADRVAQQGAAFDPARWQPPADSAIPGDSLGASIRRGLALITHTTDSLPGFAPGHINCTNCHLDGGRNVNAAPLTGSHARFPKYMDRTGAVIGLADRVNYCFTRSLAGTRLPTESREMQDILAYIAWLSNGVPIGAKLPGADGLPPIPNLTGDTTRGAAVFAAKCVACHGQDGQGNVGIPALWGPKSYSIGASMSRHSKAASFIWHNMPLGQGRTLTHQEAYDVASYVNSRPRPDSPGKENDWPVGGAPADVPYDTKEHAAFKPPQLLPRANPAATIVPRPAPVATLGNGGAH